MAATMQRDLVERARSGDREAFGTLAAGVVDRLHAVAQLIVRDPALAEDAVQEALVRCWRQLPKLREPERFDAWLYRILIRTANDELGRRRRFAVAVETVGPEPHTQDRTAQIADRDELERAFRRLSVDHRSIVVLCHFAGLPLGEAAASLGIPVGTAKSRYHYAMAALRAALEANARPAPAEEAPA
jgi:RNA polymerase sigma-70 factor (ECF subfamily)